MSSPAPVPSGDRHHLVDALRGFALLGIVIVNVEFILQPSELGWMAFTSDTDRFVRWLVATLGATKIYPIFATLFGYGLAIQFRRAGGELGPRYRRRMLVLMGLGVLHGLLFFSGDILVIYAVVGLAAFRLRDTPTATLLHIAAWTYGIAAALWLIVGGLDAIDPTRSSLDTSIDSAYLSGSFFDVVVANFWLWVFTLGFLALLQGPAVVAFFCIGIALGRTDWLARPQEHRTEAAASLRLFPAAMIVAGIGGWLSVYQPRWDTLGFALGFACAPLVAAGYVALLARWIGTEHSVVARLLGQSGRMSLTVYLLESVLAAFLAYGYGFGLLPDVGPAAGVAIALGIWASLSVFSVLWMRRFRFGPFEWFLRSMSYQELQPLVRAG